MPKRPRILFIEDDAKFRQMLAPVLRSRGHEVIEVPTGRDATTILKGNRFDLAIVDGLLPDTNGIAWIAELRKQNNPLSIIFVSAFWKDIKSYQHLTRDLNVSLVVHKPVNTSVLSDQIDALLGRMNEPEPPAQAIQRQFEILVEEYRESLPGTVGLIGSALKEVTADSLHIARAEVHKIRGTAGSYRMPAVTDTAAHLEEALVAVLASPAPARVPDPAVTRAFDIFQTAVTTALASPSAPVSTPARATGDRLIAANVSPGLAAALARLSEETDCTISTANDDAEAKTIASGAGPIAALIVGPGADGGWQLARDLKSMLPEASLVLVSPKGDTGSRLESVHLGASAFIDTPVVEESLAQILREIKAAGYARKSKILIVDDDENFSAHAASSLVDAGYFPVTLTDSTLVMEAISEVRPEVLILDVMMPGVSGYDICKMIRQSPEWASLPIIVTTVLTGLEARLATFQAGADDYLPKPFIPDELTARIKVRVDRARLERERSEKDALTGLQLRRPFVENMQAAMADSKRRNRPVALCLIDIDKFKEVNDHHGHLAGDRVLGAIGALVRSRFRTEDIRCRWGGEEFVLAFPGETGPAIVPAIERLLAEFSALQFSGDSGEPFSCTFSAGVSSTPADGGTLDLLIREADGRLYKAKREGRNRVLKG